MLGVLQSVQPAPLAENGEQNSSGITVAWSSIPLLQWEFSSRRGTDSLDGVRHVHAASTFLFPMRFSCVHLFGIKAIQGLDDGDAFASALPQRFEHNEQRFGETCVLTGRGDQVEVGLSRQRPAICRHGGYQDVPSGVRSRSDTVRCEAFGYSSTFARLVPHVHVGPRQRR